MLRAIFAMLRKKDNMDAEAVQKAMKIRERLRVVRESVKPIQRRTMWLKKKLETEPENYHRRAEYEAMSLCWTLLREEKQRLALFDARLKDILGDNYDNGTESN